MPKNRDNIQEWGKDAMDGCLALLVLLFLPNLSFADAANAEWVSTTRALTMGNVGIANATDGTSAMFYNPAALARQKKTTVELFNPQFDIGTGVFTMGGSSNIGKHSALSRVRPLLSVNKNSVSSAGFSLYPNLSAQNFNFGILMKAEGASVDDGTNLIYRSRYLLIPTMALSMGALGGRFRLGVALRGIQISENDKNVLNTTTSTIGYSMDMAEGFGIGLDAGALISLPWASLPTLGFVARNVGDTSFPSSASYSIAAGTSTKHDKIKMTYDGGFSIAPKLGQKSTFTFAADYRDILNVHGINDKRRLNLGFEIDYQRVLFFRAGYGRGYWTAGLGIGSRFGSLDLGTYSEELSATGFNGIEDRRVSLRFGSKF
jgi:hypothetical protein